MDTILEKPLHASHPMPTPLEPHSLPLHRAKRLRGMPPLHGDHLMAYQAMALASLAEGGTRIENLPDTPALKEALEAFAALGLLRSEMLDGQSVVHGGSLGQSAEEESAVPETITVRDETLALVLAGLVSGRKLKPMLAIDTHSVGLDIARLIAEALPDPNSGLKAQDIPSPMASSGAPADNVEPEADRPSLPDFLNIHPGELTSKLRRLRETGLKPKTLKWDEAAAKALLLTQALASGEAAWLELVAPGSDVYESLVQHFRGNLQVDRGEPPEGDELARRIARQMKAAGNKEDFVRFRLEAGAQLKATPLTLPRDVTEASMWALAATLVKGSDLVLDGVLLNASRTAFFSALRRMGADIEIVTRREKQGFAYGQVRVRSSELIAKRFDGEALSGMRDEIFLLIVAAAFAEGETVIRDITHLRGYREDLLKSFLAQLKATGVEAGEFEDGLVVRGRSDYDGNHYDAAGHPGLAAACVAMALKSHGESLIQGAEGLLWRMPDLMSQIEALQTEATKDKEERETKEGEA
jgi:5-enolpyruvylshikimate-3-phosphate synthase